jgi:bifunctional DNA-binding transcriptional regulator/antitoxin component of YhaV-PrlF toxin-antitoxin module
MGKRKYKGRGRIDGNGRIVIQKELFVALGLTEGTRFIQTLRDGGIFLEVPPDVCRICYSEDEEMFGECKICVGCARKIIQAAESE